MRRRVLSALVAVLMVAGLILTFTPRAEAVYFAVVNEAVKTLSNANMPISYDGKMYLPQALFNDPAFKVYTSYNAEDYSITFFNASKILTFNLNTGIAYDQEKLYTQKAVMVGGLVYVPAEFICQQFGWKYAYLDVGPSVRIVTSSSKITDAMFENIAENYMKTLLDEYNAAQVTQPPSGGAVTPSSPGQTPEARREVYITVDGGPDESTALILDALDKYGYQAAFFLDGQRLFENPDLLRRLWGSGHTVGLLYDGDMDKLARENDLLDAMLLTRTRFVRFERRSRNVEDELVIDKLIAAGFRFWDYTISSSESSGDLAGSVIRSLKKTTGTPVLRLISNQETAQAIKDIFFYLSGEGYIVRSISESTMPVNDKSDVR